jgi:hypothetical protein
MKGLLRRLRGIIGTGLTWAVGWAGIFSVLGVIFGAGSIPAVAVVGAFTGLVSGGAFAVILSIAERRHRLEDLSLWRTALWGGLGGILVAAAFSGSWENFWSFAATMAVSASASSAGTVAVAKRADRKLIEGHDDAVVGIEGDDELPPALGGT